MSNLKNYINNVKELTKELNEIETIRYIYLDLGKRFSFDKRFYAGNSSQKKASYKESGTFEAPEESMTSGIIVCRTSSRILETILNHLGIKTHSYTVYGDPDKNHPHVYNICSLKDGRVLSFDLQQDLNNIQSRSRTKFFGLNPNQDCEMIPRFELEQIDKKLGYISDKEYYSDSFVEMLKYHANMFDDFYAKVDFVLQNLEIFENRFMEYPERNWYHQRIVGQIFLPKDLKKIKFMKCYYKGSSGERDYRNYVGIEKGEKPIFYRYNDEEGKYDQISYEELIQDEHNGLIIETGVYGLKQINKKYLDEKDK